jgi:Holliday junction DNA helicase RuvB
MCSALLSKLNIFASKKTQVEPEVHPAMKPDSNEVKRPLFLEDYVGQDVIKEQLRIKINLFKRTNQAMSHTLLLGFPGAGKTTLARIIANEMGVKFYEFMGQDFPNSFELLHFFENIEPNAIIFIDEMHNIKGYNQEWMYPMLEDFAFAGKSFGRKFTVIGATTHAGSLNTPFLDRFGYKPIMTPYTSEQLFLMMSNFSTKLMPSVTIPQEVLMSMATLCQGVPRKGINLIKNFIDYVMAMVEEDRNLISSDFTLERLTKCLQFLDIDPFLGLDRLNRDYLNILYSEKSKPIGAKSLSTMCNIQEVTLVNVIEPFLLSQYIKLPIGEDKYMSGPLVKMTRQGRIPTGSAELYLKSCKKLQEDQGWFNGEIFSV